MLRYGCARRNKIVHRFVVLQRREEWDAPFKMEGMGSGSGPALFLLFGLLLSS